MKCGCKIVLEQGGALGRTAYIEYCPLHSAAEQTLEALKWAHDELLELQNPEGIEDALRVINKALKKAEQSSQA